MAVRKIIAESGPVSEESSSKKQSGGGICDASGCHTNLETQNAKSRGVCDTLQIALLEEDAPHEYECSRNDKNEKDKTVGAAVAGGILGFTVGGPVLGITTAGGAAYLASKNSGSAGMAARSAGDVMLAVGEKIKELHQKHNLVERAGNNIAGGSERDDENEKKKTVGAAVAGGILGCTIGGPFLGITTAGGAAYLASTNSGSAGTAARSAGDFMLAVGEKMKEFDQKHNVFETMCDGIADGSKWLEKKYKMMKDNAGGMEV